MTYTEVVEWWKGLQLNNYKDYAQRLHKFNVMFVCNSLNLDGMRLTFPVVKNILEDAPVTGVCAADMLHVYNHKLVFEIMLQHLLSGNKLSIPFIQKVHGQLMQGLYTQFYLSTGESPGKFKLHQYGRGTKPEYILPEMKELLGDVNRSITDAISSAVYFHAVLNLIQPFSEGTDRVGRVLMNYILLLNNLPPVIIYSEDYRTYRAILDNYRSDGELSKVIDFIKWQITKTWTDQFVILWY